jgi:hypothetical protein
LVTERVIWELPASTDDTVVAREGLFERGTLMIVSEPPKQVVDTKPIGSVVKAEREAEQTRALPTRNAVNLGGIFIT